MHVITLKVYYKNNLYFLNYLWIFIRPVVKCIGHSFFPSQLRKISFTLIFKEIRPVHISSSETARCKQLTAEGQQARDPPHSAGPRKQCLIRIRVAGHCSAVPRPTASGQSLLGEWAMAGSHMSALSNHCQLRGAAPSVIHWRDDTWW